MVREKLRFGFGDKNTSYRERDDWRDEAACKESDPGLFTLIDSVGGLEHWEQNKRNFKQAEKICATCPVIEECWKDSSSEEREWTMRGGAWPEKYMQPQAEDEQDEEVCFEGHAWKIFEGDARGCRHCGSKRAIAARRAKEELDPAILAHNAAVKKARNIRKREAIKARRAADPEYDARWRAARAAEHQRWYAKQNKLAPV